MVLVLDDDVIHRFEWLGMFDSEKKVGSSGTTALDAVCILFEEKMQYAEGEKDMICMKHTFDVEYDGGRREQITSTLIDFGQQPDGNTSMSRTVALPLAIAVRAVLEKRITLTGIQRPIVPELYNPILDEMETLGVKFDDVHQPLHVHLRHEVKPKEYRAALTPETTKTLVSAGFRVDVERSATRCFKDSEYEEAGARLVETGSWEGCPLSSVVLGLKELPADAVVRQNHVMFAHCFKGQDEAEGVLKNFAKNKGNLFDLEFLTDERGRRVAAFGHAAGYVGSALGLLEWGLKRDGGGLGELSDPWTSNELLIEEVKGKLGGQIPTVHILGALGRAGRGAADFAEAVGAKVIKWDLEETKPGGPFPVLLDADVVVNCIYLSSPIPPFLTKELVETEGKNLRVIVDVSCDPNNPNNPLPVYNTCTTVFDPIFPIPNSKVGVIAIDHLPSLLPAASSTAFSNDLTPHLLHLGAKDEGDYAVWKRAYNLFVEKKAPYS
uniref:Saccharopine dehydrogenase [NAD(+), L-lysine-forming] n=1 Tax=Paramoeba aestuarina TaxID=180227 RepID=A0A7S4UK19_9EUKA